MSLIDIIAQCVIAVFGVGAIYLSQDVAPERRRWAPVLGLLAQPAWFFTAIHHEQWGLLCLNFLYGYSWLRGFINQWLRRPA